MTTERHFKILIRPHIDLTLKQYAVVTCRLINPAGDFYAGNLNHDTEFSFNLEYLMTDVEELYRAWFIAHVARNVIDPIVEENKWEITTDLNEYMELVKTCEVLWQDYKNTLDIQK